MFSPALEDTLLGQTVKDREGRGNRQQAVQWSARQQWGWRQESSVGQTGFCGRSHHLCDKSRILLKYGLKKYFLSISYLLLLPFSTSCRVYGCSVCLLSYSLSVVTEGLELQPVCCPAFCKRVCFDTKRTHTAGLSPEPSYNNEGPSEDSSVGK